VTRLRKAERIGRPVAQVRQARAETKMTTLSPELISTRRSSTRGTPRGLLGSSGLITRHSKSVRSYRLMADAESPSRHVEKPHCSKIAMPTKISMVANQVPNAASAYPRALPPNCRRP